MRILYVDIDSLRADHLGCYGYHRDTSPNIDRVAAEGIRFDNFYVSDTPCLPSRTALWCGRFGIHNGTVGHGGTAAEPFGDGPARGFASVLAQTSWMQMLRQAGYSTATVSSFGERHAAWHWYANFNEIHNPGKRGMDTADEVCAIAGEWLQNHGRRDNWFLHVNFWDPHTPYRAPADYPNIFADQPCPAWLTDSVRAAHWNACGPHSAQEAQNFLGGDEYQGKYPRQPVQMDSMDEVRRMFDGYDLGIRYADDHIGRLLDMLAGLGVLDDTAVIISADHGENLGELNIYGDHQTADAITPRIPLVIRWPGVTQPGVGDSALHYHVDLAATLADLMGVAKPANWDAASFAETLRSGAKQGHPYLVLSQGAWTCQRSVRWQNFICIHSLHDGYHDFPDMMLFDLEADPHEQNDLAPTRPDLVAEAMGYLQEWETSMMRTATHPYDPMWTVLGEGGPSHTRGQLTTYAARLRTTSRAAYADRLLQKHPGEA